MPPFEANRNSMFYASRLGGRGSSKRKPHDHLHTHSEIIITVFNRDNSKCAHHYHLNYFKPGVDRR